MDEATRRFSLIRDGLFMSVEEELISLERTDSIKKSSSAILTLIQSAQDKLDRFFTMSKSYSQIEFFLVDWSEMTKSIRVECVHHLASFAEKNIESGNQQILLPISAFLKLWSESTIEYCLGKGYRQSQKK